MRKWLRPRYFFLALVVLVVGSFAEFAYRTNYVCDMGEHILQSDIDAIEQAQRQIFKAHYGTHNVPGYVDEKPGVGHFSQPNCCEVKKFMTLFGVIVWEVGLEGETIGEPKKRHISALMMLSNCGAVFRGESRIFASPIR